jgi:hypothetical protein
MINGQGGQCAACGDQPSTLYIDHDHETGKARQLICPGCNTLAGSLENEKTSMVIEYLRHHNSNALARLELILKERKDVAAG